MALNSRPVGRVRTEVLVMPRGWPAILALSIAGRWPFHVYHGTLSSIPWAIIWGGAFAAAFLTWRF